MSNLHLREKMKKIMEASKNSDQIPERSKHVGFIIFLLFIAIAIIALLALTVSFIVNGMLVIAIITLLITALLAYSTFKMMKADDIHQL